MCESVRVLRVRNVFPKISLSTSEFLLLQVNEFQKFVEIGFTNDLKSFNERGPIIFFLQEAKF